MIDKQSGRYHLVCDICGEETEETFDDFYDCSKITKTERMEKPETNGRMGQSVCPGCQEVE